MIEWIKELKFGRLIPKEELKNIIFLMDSGYDCKELQWSIKFLGAHFIMAIKTTRKVGGKNIINFFKYAKLPTKTIQLIVGANGKKKKREFSTKTAEGVRLNGVGKVTAVCSQIIGRRARKKKYFVCSSPDFDVKEIIRWYICRWRIELWHKEMKQNHGYSDCRSSNFVAVTTHLYCTLIAYLFCVKGNLVKMTGEEFVIRRKMEMIGKQLNQFGGKHKIKAEIKDLLSPGFQKIAA